MSETQKIIAVDLDGTLAEYDGWQGVEHIGSPIQKIVHTLRILKERDWYIRIFTCRLNGTNTKLGRVDLIKKNQAPIKNWLDAFNIPYDEITLNIEGKPFAHVYLDDRALNPLDYDTTDQILKVCEKLAKEEE